MVKLKVKRQLEDKRIKPAFRIVEGLLIMVWLVEARILRTTSA